MWEEWRPLLGLFSVGTVLVACIVVGYFLGAFLDERWHTAPWLMVVFVGVGSAAGFIEMIRIVRRYTK